MSDRAQQRHPMTKVPVLYRIPGVDSVVVQRDLAYTSGARGEAGADGRTMDVYHPPDAKTGTRLPAVVIVEGYPGLGFAERMGCQFKDMEHTVSWARLLAASGMAAITYTNHEPAADLDTLLEHVRQNAASLSVDPQRLGAWASSGHVPLALSLLMSGCESPRFTCAVLCYGYTLDLDGSTAVADASRAWGFANPAAGKSVDDLSGDVPLFLARAGQDGLAGLNDALDRFLARAVARNLPITFTNHPEGPHAFDMTHDSETTRRIVQQVLTFLQSHLGA
jgi:dienelactone hydrolase